MNRHLSRIVTMQTLYEWDFRHDLDLDEIADRNIEEYSDRCEGSFVKNAAHGVADKKDELDKTIDESAPEWPIDQVSLVDKTVLRLAVYELFYDKDVPVKVVINEAVELSKEFGSQNSSKFVNGVLGSVFKKHETEILQGRENNIQPNGESKE